VKRLLLAALSALAVLALPGHAAAAPTAQCGLPDTKPLWIDYGAPELKATFGRPGVIVAGSGEAYPGEMRKTGAQTVFWDMYLNRRVGTPSVPADPAVLEERANRLFDFAVLSAACPTPWIVMNELFGASASTPWTRTQAAYRANVLRWARLLAAKGAKPILLVSSRAFTGGDAAQWWRDFAAVGDIVLEKYFAAPNVHRAGPVSGSRDLRVSLRKSASELFAIGIPPSKLGFMFGFQTRRGSGGREGLEAGAWFEVAKLQALAGQQVARELGIAHLWSWGWGHFDDTAAFDEDKRGAACAWLWARDPALCDAPGLLGDRFDADRDEGQIALAAGTRCTLGANAITLNGIADLRRVTGDAEVSLSALYRRAVESRLAAPTWADVLQAERGIVKRRFRGSRSAYLAAVVRARATLALARGVIADELRRIEIQRDLRVATPPASALAEFHATYGEVLAREVQVSPAPRWLPSGTGFALASTAPPELFTLEEGATASVRTVEGTFTVRVLGEATPLGAIPLETARPAIARVLRDLERGNAYYDWTLRRQRSALEELRCVRDRLPSIGAVELTSYLPFLALTDGA
jgi:hypothetical protein